MFMSLRSLVLLCMTAAIIYGLLLIPTISSLYYVKHAALLVLVLHVADNFIKYIWNSLPSPTISKLQDTAVLITGCDTGFGNKLARQLDAKGVTVFAGCLFAKGPCAQQLEKDCSAKLNVLQLDVTNQEQVNAAVTSVKDTLKGKPLLSIVNNAGIFLMAELELTPLEELKKPLEVNTIGVVRVTQAFLPLLKKSKGRVVIVTSMASYISVNFLGAYTMSKFATRAYAEILRLEMMRWSITVHTIEPWIFRTEMVNKEASMAKINAILNSKSEEIQEEYGGDKYMNLAQSGWDFILFFGNENNKITVVTNCMEDAAIGKYPKVSYCPGIKGKFLSFLLRSLPRALYDLIFYILLKYFSKDLQKKTV